MTITLEDIVSQQSRINDMIEAFKTQALPSERRIPAVTIPLAAGEKFAGMVLAQDGGVDYFLILLPGDTESVTWSQAREWAAERGGHLPTRREQSLLFANLKDEFEAEYYWSDEQHESNSGWAWCQYFHDGYQGDYHQYDELRARAVRRFIPSVI
jgi:hypothetical protein